MDGCDYAIKKVAFDATGYSNEAIQEVVREVQCLATVSDHPNIVRYHTSWLEPSWMTGSGQLESNIPQHKLLTELQQLMQPSDDDDDDEAGENGKNGSSYFTRDPSSASFGQRRRRFSFGSSVDEMDQSWEEYHSQSLGDLGFAYDDSYLVSRKKPHPKPQSPTYRYQICLYIQMQLCHPATLADWIRERNRQIPEAEHARRIGPALDIFQQIVMGLAHVHAKGIIHRDLKPANIFASSDGRVIKIGDFGLSKQLLGVKSSTTPNQHQDTTPTSKTAARTEYSHTQECWHQAKANDGALIQIHKTKTQTLVEYGKTTVDPLTAGVGTASYASPEQVKSRTYGTAADIFSAGLILLELLSCFETEHERLHNFQQCRNQRLPPWIHKIYPDIAAIILACTRADPNQRPTAKDLLERIMARAPCGDKTHHKDVHILKGQLVEREEELEKQKNELAEKDRIIENLRLEMERMKATLLLTNEPTATQLQEAEVQVERVMVEEATSFKEDN
jgi:serine/threonine protein kinase